jgi:hypothetical protein
VPGQTGRCRHQPTGRQVGELLSAGCERGRIQWIEVVELFKRGAATARYAVQIPEALDDDRQGDEQHRGDHVEYAARIVRKVGDVGNVHKYNFPGEDQKSICIVPMNARPGTV